MSAVKRLTDVIKTATMPLVHTPVAATEDIVSYKIESLVSV